MKHTDMQKFPDVRLGWRALRHNPSSGHGCRFWFCGSLLVLLILAVSGCKTANVNSTLAAHPEKYRRVAILPICFGNASPTGFAVEAGESDELRQRAGEDLASALASRLAQKGYQVVNPVRVLSSEKDWYEIDLTASGILRQQFDLERIRANPGDTNLLYTYGFVSSLPVLQERLALPEADAILLVERWEGYVALGKTDKSMPLAAKIVIYPVGIAAVTFMCAAMVAGGDIPDLVNTFDSGQLPGAQDVPSTQPEFSTCYSLYVFDPNEHQIIYSACESQRFQSPSRAARALLGALPKIKD